MKKIIITILSLIITSTSCHASLTPISSEKELLPKQVLIKYKYKKRKMIRIDYDPKMLTINYG